MKIVIILNLVVIGLAFALGKRNLELLNLRQGISWSNKAWGYIEKPYGRDETNGYEVVLVSLYDEQEIQRLRDRGHHVVCSFSAGRIDETTILDSRWTNLVVADGEPLSIGSWLDISRKQELEPLLGEKLDLARENGCVGVEADWINCYVQDECWKSISNNANDVQALQVELNTWIATSAHERGLIIGLKNCAHLVSDLVDHFDFAITTQCIEYNFCGSFRPFSKQNKPILNTEYKSYRTLCSKAAKQLTKTKYCSGVTSNGGSCSESSSWENCFRTIPEFTYPPEPDPTKKPTPKPTSKPIFTTQEPTPEPTFRTEKVSFPSQTFAFSNLAFGSGIESDLNVDQAPVVLVSLEREDDIKGFVGGNYHTVICSFDAVPYRLGLTYMQQTSQEKMEKARKLGCHGVEHCLFCGTDQQQRYGRVLAKPEPNVFATRIYRSLREEYTYSMDVLVDGLLSWNVLDNGYLQVLLEVQKNTWIAFGISEGGMVGGRAIIGANNDVGEYQLEAKQLSGIVAYSGNSDMIDSSFEVVGNVATLKFTAATIGGARILEASNLILAMGTNPSFSKHSEVMKVDKMYWGDTSNVYLFQYSMKIFSGRGTLSWNVLDSKTLEIQVELQQQGQPTKRWMAFGINNQLNMIGSRIVLVNGDGNINGQYIINGYSFPNSFEKVTNNNQNVANVNYELLENGKMRLRFIAKNIAGYDLDVLGQNFVSVAVGKGTNIEKHEFAQKMKVQWMADRDGLEEDYASWFADKAGENNLLVGFRDSKDLSAKFESKLDFAVAIGCQTPNTCVDDYSKFIQRKKPVLNVEYQKLSKCQNPNLISTKYCDGNVELGTCNGALWENCLKVTKLPSASPTRSPTSKPTKPDSTKVPTATPIGPTARPTKPTRAPTTSKPTRAPTNRPTKATPKPTTGKPTASPTNRPTAPTKSPTTPRPSKSPTKSPTKKPTDAPTSRPTRPTAQPTGSPTNRWEEEVPILDGLGRMRFNRMSDGNLEIYITYDATKGWLGFGISPDASMVGSHVIIGMESSKNKGYPQVGEYIIRGRSKSKIELQSGNSRNLAGVNAVFQRYGGQLHMYFIGNEIAGKKFNADLDNLVFAASSGETFDGHTHAEAKLLFWEETKAPTPNKYDPTKNLSGGQKIIAYMLLGMLAMLVLIVVLYRFQGKKNIDVQPDEKLTYFRAVYRSLTVHT